MYRYSHISICTYIYIICIYVYMYTHIHIYVYCADSCPFACCFVCLVPDLTILLSTYIHICRRICIYIYVHACVGTNNV